MFEDIPEGIVNQRTRNRIIEVLDYYALVDTLTPLRPNEILDMWEEWVDDNSLQAFQSPAFSPEEIHAISNFHDEWKVACYELPDSVKSASQLVKESAWQELVAKSQIALALLMQRGMLSEDREID